MDALQFGTDLTVGHNEPPLAIGYLVNAIDIRQRYVVRTKVGIFLT